MTTRTLFFTAMLLCTGNVCFSQTGSATNGNSTDNSPVTADAPAKKAAKGTYQVIIRISKVQPVFSDEILIEVEKARDENEVKYLQLGENAKVKILPRKTISEPGFTPVEEVVYVEQL